MTLVHPTPCRRYDQEEFGANSDSQHHNPFVGDDSMFNKRQEAAQQRLTRRDGSVMTLAQVRCCCRLPSAACDMLPSATALRPSPTPSLRHAASAASTPVCASCTTLLHSKPARQQQKGSVHSRHATLFGPRALSEGHPCLAPLLDTPALHPCLTPLPCTPA